MAIPPRCRIISVPFVEGTGDSLRGERVNKKAGVAAGFLVFRFRSALVTRAPLQALRPPAGQKALRALPAHRFVTNGAGDAVRYLYAEPQHCVCIFVGTQQAYDRYRDLLSQPLKPTDNVPADYRTQSSILLSNQPLRQSTRGDPTTLSDYLSTLR